MLDDAAIETMFERLAADDPAPDWAPKGEKHDPFRTLVSVVLSARTQGVNTAKATRQLFDLIQTPADLAALPLDALAGAIRPAGLYNQKAKGLLAMAQSLVAEHGNRVPTTRAGLMSLPGVGRKSADIVLRFAFKAPVCAVDTHVFRLSKRTGLAEGATPDKVADELERRIPKRFKPGSHLWLFRFGRDTCTPQRPKCPVCPLLDLCERNGVKAAL